MDAETICVFKLKLFYYCMILLVGTPGSARSSLATFLEHEGLSTKVCDSYADAAVVYANAPQFDLIVGEFRVAGSGVLTLMGELERKGHAPAFVVLGAPLKAEAELFRRGALAVLGAGYSPRSAALQALALSKFINRRPFRLAQKARPAPAEEFQFGSVRVLPERRVIQGPKRKGTQPANVPLSRLQLRILQALQASPARILDYESLYHSIWRRAYRGNNAAIREAVSSLRERLRLAGVDFDQWVTTVYGEGYRYEG